MTDARWETSSLIAVDWLDWEKEWLTSHKYQKLRNYLNQNVLECSKKTVAPNSSLYFLSQLYFWDVYYHVHDFWLQTRIPMQNEIHWGKTLHFAEYTVVSGLSHDLYLSFSINALLKMHFPLGIFKKNHDLFKMKWFTESIKFKQCSNHSTAFAWIRQI